jgi:hypothetical protein
MSSIMKRSAPLKRTGFARPGFKPFVRPERPARTLPRLYRQPAPFVLAFTPAPKDPAPLRDRTYRMFVASLPCFACGAVGHCQAAHSNSHDKGARRKASDAFLFPLCTVQVGQLGCHEKHDQLIGLTLEERRVRELAYVERMRPIAAAAGWRL